MVTFGQLFANRTAAGIELARAVRQQVVRVPQLILGLPRGGVPVAYEIARSLELPLDVMPVRKIGMPGNPEAAIGAIAGRTVVRASNLSHYWPTHVFAELARIQRAELRRRERVYRAGIQPLNLKGVDVLLVDDGLATGFTMLAAIREARRLEAGRVSIAAPVAADDAEALVSAEADQSIILRIEVNLSSVGAAYADFSQVADEEVSELLIRSRARRPGSRIACSR